MDLIHIAWMLIAILGFTQVDGAQPAKLSADAIVAHQQASWNAGDGHAWAADYAEDADFVNILGTALHGRAEIEARHAAILAGPFSGSHLTITIRSYTLLSSTVAVVETNQEVTGFRSLPPGIGPTEPGVLKTHMKYLLVQHGTGWVIVAAQNTAISPAPPHP